MRADQAAPVPNTSPWRILMKTHLPTGMSLPACLASSYERAHGIKAGSDQPHLLCATPCWPRATQEIISHVSQAISIHRDDREGNSHRRAPSGPHPWAALKACMSLKAFPPSHPWLSLEHFGGLCSRYRAGLNSQMRKPDRSLWGQGGRGRGSPCRKRQHPSI